MENASLLLCFGVLYANATFISCYPASSYIHGFRQDPWYRSSTHMKWSTWFNSLEANVPHVSKCDCISSKGKNTVHSPWYKAATEQSIDVIVLYLFQSPLYVLNNNKIKILFFPKRISKLGPMQLLCNYIMRESLRVYLGIKYTQWNTDW